MIFRPARYHDDMTATDTTLGLRERKKRAMRASLSAIALRHAMERGVAQVRVDDIAAEAGVSPRTFNNYFPSKEAAIVGTAASRAELFGSALRARPASESLHQALCEATLALFPEEPDRSWVARSQLLRSEASLQAEERKSDAEVERVLAAEIARRTGMDARRDLYPRVAAATVVATIHAALQYWLDASDGATLRETMRHAMGHLAIVPPPR